MIIYEDVEQNSPQWFDLRCGIVTASNVCKIITPTGKISEAKSRIDYIYEIVSEKISETPSDYFDSPDMMRGRIDEPTARKHYVEQTKNNVNQVGFITDNFNDNIIGYSPDGLVGDDGIIEIKSRKKRLQIETLYKNQTPQEYYAQIQTGLLVSGRKWCDFISYCDDLPLFVKRIYPDLKYHETIINGVNDFYLEVEQIKNKIMEQY
jgi:putative phage-type endonuclease